MPSNPIDERITRFIGKHHVLTIATVNQACEPYCANVFYSYLPQENIFVFTTEENTRHYKEMMESGFAAGSVVLETRTVGKVQGLQLQGNVSLLKGDEAKQARRSYIKRFPYAMVTDLILWQLQPTYMKLTDNTLGFGKKLIWNGTGTSIKEGGGHRVDRDDRQPSGSGAV